MVGPIPLIRSGALVPFMRWMLANGRPLEARLRAADLGYFPHGEPDLPIPLIPAIAFVAAASRDDGADLPCRLVSAASLRELGLIGRVALGSRTVREALGRIAAAAASCYPRVDHRAAGLGRFARAGILGDAAGGRDAACLESIRGGAAPGAARIPARLCRCSSVSRSCRIRSMGSRICGPGSMARSRRRATAASSSSFRPGWRTGTCAPARPKGPRRAPGRPTARCAAMGS